MKLHSVGAAVLSVLLGPTAFALGTGFSRRCARFAAGASLWLLATSLSAQSFTGAMSGTWWNPQRNGEGQFITFEQVGARQVVVLAYFTYDDAGNPSWLVGSSDLIAGSNSIAIAVFRASGPRFGAGFDPAAVALTAAGTITLDYLACGRMRFRYQGSEALDFPLERLVGALNGPNCDNPLASSSASVLVGALSGGWWVPARSGEGQFLAFERVGDRRVATLIYFTYDPAGRARWLVGSADYADGAASISIPLFSGRGARFGAAFSSADVQIAPAGQVRLESLSCSQMRIRYDGNVAFGLDIKRSGGPLIGSPCTLVAPPPSTTDAALRLLIAREGLSGDASANRELPGIDAPLAQLGKLLFFSKSLSGNNDVACATCHHPSLGGGDQLALPIGPNAVNANLLGPGRRLPDNSILVGRNSNTFFNVGLYDRGLFWDSRVESLVGQPLQNGTAGGIRTPDSVFGSADLDAGGNLVAAQARFPVAVVAEMRGNGFVGLNDPQMRAHLAARIGNYGSGQGQLPASQWLPRFRTAFGSQGSAEELVTFNNIAQAVGEYQRSATFVESPWARYVRGDNLAIGEDAKQGALVFFKTTNEGGAQCAQCHSGDFFTDERHHALGFPQIGPGPGDPGSNDLGRARQTGNSIDRQSFRTPSLLNVELTAPYGHAGAYADLETTFNHYVITDLIISDFLRFRQWCALAPFLGQSTCLAAAATVSTNTQIALAQMRAQRAANPANAMPVVDPNSVPIESITQMTAFLHSLTDPCLRTRNCFRRWIPTPDEAPDGLQLNAVNAQGNPL